MKNFNQTFFNNNKSRNQISLMNKYPSSKLIELNQNFDSLSSLSALSGIADNSLNKNYKQFALRQINMQIDTKMLGLIAKLNDEKTFETLKSQFDDEKKQLLLQAMKKLHPSNSDYINNHLNLKNFHTKLNQNYTYDAADNLLMHSFFDKIKTRKRKVFKIKHNNYIDILYQGISSPKKMKKLPIKENPEIKYDYKALIKSNSELDKYFKNKLKKVSFKTSSSEKEDNKEENNNNFQKKYDNANILKKRRRSLDKKIPLSLNNQRLSMLDIKNNENKSSSNLPNIKEKTKFDIIDKKKEIKSNKLDSENKKRNNKNNNTIKEVNESFSFSFDSGKKSRNNKLILNSKTKDTSIQLELFKNNIIKVSESELNPKKIFDKKAQSSPSKKMMSQTMNSKFLKNDIKKIFPFYLRISEDGRTQYMNRLNKQKFNKVISEFDEKEKKIEKKYIKINKLINNLKSKNKKSNSPKTDKRRNVLSKDKNRNINETNRIKSPKKAPRLIFKEWNEATSLFHFPLINKVIYKSQEKSDDIDRIKSNLRKEYVDKLKRNRIEFRRGVDGKKIMKKLNDKYELERLIDYAEELKEKQRKKEQFQNIKL